MKESCSGTMERTSFIVLCVCISLSYCEDTYFKAGVIQDTSRNVDFNRYLPVIHDAGKLGVDIIVLPSPERSDAETNYDEAVKNLANTARKADLYVVGHLYENARCQNKNELIRSSLVFNREGNIVSVYRKPLNNLANCTASNPDIATFTTDFGVKFGLLMAEDLVLQNPGNLKSIKNFIVTGEWTSEIPLLNSQQISSTWAFTTNANLISHTGIFAGRSGTKNGNTLVVANLSKNGGEGMDTPPVINPLGLRSLPYEDLSQYIIRPLDLEASSRGYKETVCHKKFCCEFYIKTNFEVSKVSALNYGLAAFDGIRRFDRDRYIGAQTCAVFACAGLYKRSCAIGSNNNTDVSFEEVSISANFTKHNTIQYPIMISSDTIKSEQFNFDTKSIPKSKQAKSRLTNAEFLTFSVFGRDFAKDFESPLILNKTNDGIETDNAFNFIFNEEFKEVIDYLWIRLRILIFVVSIYILEMM